VLLVELDVTSISADAQLSGNGPTTSRVVGTVLHMEHLRDRSMCRFCHVPLSVPRDRSTLLVVMVSDGTRVQVIYLDGDEVHRCQSRVREPVPALV